MQHSIVNNYSMIFYLGGCVVVCVLRVCSTCVLYVCPSLAWPDRYFFTGRLSLAVFTGAYTASDKRPVK